MVFTGQDWCAHQHDVHREVLPAGVRENGIDIGCMQHSGFSVLAAAYLHSYLDC